MRSISSWHACNVFFPLVTCSLPIRKSAKERHSTWYVFLQMLVLRSDWQAALPTLTQLGNGLALVTCLDSMLGSQADCAFMQLAPLLGITLGIGNHMQRSVSQTRARLSRVGLSFVFTDCVNTSVSPQTLGKTLLLTNKPGVLLPCGVTIHIALACALRHSHW